MQFIELYTCAIQYTMYLNDKFKEMGVKFTPEVLSTLLEYRK